MSINRSVVSLPNIGASVTNANRYSPPAFLAASPNERAAIASRAVSNHPEAIAVAATQQSREVNVRRASAFDLYSSAAARNSNRQEPVAKSTLPCPVARTQTRFATQPAVPPAAQSDSVVVFTGSIFESKRPKFIGGGKVAVPSHAFKVILVRQGGRKTMFAAIVPNTDQVLGPLHDFATPVDEVERRTGLDFFAALDDAEERKLESSLKSLPSSARN